MQSDLQPSNVKRPLPMFGSSPTYFKKMKIEMNGGNCVVCNAPDSLYHFGVIACAACSAFFRRTIALKRSYKCRRDPSGATLCPIDRRHRCNCRACRFTICLSKGMDPSCVQYSRDSIRSKTPQESEDDEDGAHNESKSCNMLEQLENIYRLAKHRRRMFYCNGSLRDILDSTDSKIRMRPTRFDERYYKDKMRFELVIYLEMMNSLQVFRQLDISTKEILVRGCTVSIALLEKYYISIQNGGLEHDRLISPDMSYTDLSDNGAQFDDEFFRSNSALMDKKTCLQLLYDPLREVLREFGNALKCAKLSDTEFCALFALLLFNPSAVNLSEDGRKKVRIYRNMAIADWFQYYTIRGIDSEQASQLVGNTVLLLSELQNAMHVHRENFHVIRVFNIMEYDKLIDDLNFT